MAFLLKRTTAKSMKEDFIANAIGTLDLMHAECKTSKQCAPTAEYASKVDELVTLYHDKLETVQPAVLEDSQLANLLQRRRAGREQGAESLLQAVFWTKSPPSLTDDQKSKSKREIVFDGADSWDIYDCGWSSGEPAESLYPSDGSPLTDSDCGGKLGTITCPCTSPTLDPQDKSGWPAAVAVILSASLANINFPVSSALAILVKEHKTELVTTMLNDCVAAVCDRCIQTDKTYAQGGRCQKDWTYYNAFITSARDSTAPIQSRCGYYGAYYRTHDTASYRETAAWCCSQYGSHVGHTWADAASSSPQPPCNRAAGCGTVEPDSVIVHGDRWQCSQQCPTGFNPGSPYQLETCPAQQESLLQASDKSEKVDDLISMLASSSTLGDSHSASAGWDCG